jgi:uncharacterized protein
MRLTMCPTPVSVVRLSPDDESPAWADGEPLSSVTRTANELSVVCPTTAVPDDVQGQVQGPFVAVVIDEVLEFSQVGVLVALLQPLADGGIPVLTVSTFDTDWVLIEAYRAATAAALWRAAGYEIVEPPPTMHPGRPDDE